MKAKKLLSLFLSLLMIFSVVQVGFVPVAAVTDDAYATIFTASDYQGGDPWRGDTFTALINSLKNAGYGTPDALLFGGDYAAGSSGQDATDGINAINAIMSVAYPAYNTADSMFIQGNHDAMHTGFASTGLHDMGDFYVYAINYSDFETQTGTLQVAADITVSFENLVASGNRKPIFVMSHKAFHKGRGDNPNANIIVNALNGFADTLDIIALYGHNHSENYDDYIGGAVVYLEKGSTMLLPDDTTTNIGFTYMNYGYVAPTKNGTTGGSVNVNTATAIELLNNTIEISFYETGGLHATHTIERVRPLYTDPAIDIIGGNNAKAGSGESLSTKIYNIENPVSYTWTSDNPSVVSVSGSGSGAQVVYRSAGTANVTVTVTDAAGNSYSQTKTIIVGSASAADKTSSLTYNGVDVNNGSLTFYNKTPGTQIRLTGTFEGFVQNAQNVTTSWNSSNPTAISVNNGVLTFNSKGVSTITYTVTDGSLTLVKTVDVLISDESEPSDLYVLTDRIIEGKEYAIATSNVSGNTAYVATSGTKTSGTKIYVDTASVKLGAVNDTTGFTSQNESIVFVAEKSGSNIYLKSKETGKYLSAPAVGDIAYVDSISQASAIAVDRSNYGFIEIGGIYLHYSGTNKAIHTNRYAYNTAGCFLYEKLSSTPSVTLKNGSENVKDKSFELTTDNLSNITLTGAYSDFGAGVAASWTSSNETVATVNGGVVTFTGTEGTTTITYSVRDDEGNMASASVSYEVKAPSTDPDQPDPDQPGQPSGNGAFVLTTSPLIDGNEYVIVRTNALGGANAATKDLSSASGGKLQETSSVEIVRIGDSVGFYTQDDNAVFVAEEHNGNMYLKSKVTDLYMKRSGANIAFVSDISNATEVTVQNGKYKLGTYFFHRSGRAVYISTKTKEMVTSSSTKDSLQPNPHSTPLFRSVTARATM